MAENPFKYSGPQVQCSTLFGRPVIAVIVSAADIRPDMVEHGITIFLRNAE
jgi:hypothetical protein